MNNMQKARAKMMLKHPFFATLVLSTPWVERTDIPTAATDGKYMYYNPAFMDSLENSEQIQFVLAHESAHVMFEHVFRRGNRNPTLWNIAADFAINWILVESGFEMPKKDGKNIGLLDKKYADKTAEQIYDELQKETEKKGGLRGDGKGGVEGFDPGGMGGDILDPADMSPEERAKTEREVRQRVAQAASVARMAGKVPGALARHIDEILNPSVPWYEYLREYMTAVAADDESWLRRNRRYTDYVFPSRHSERMGEIIFIGDTSGSISNQELAKVAAETAFCAEQVKPEKIRLVWADTRVAGEQEFECGEPIRIDPKGGGGTDMCVPLKYVEKYEPVVVVLMTDGHTPWPKDTSYPLIVCCTTDAPVPLGKVIRM